jgi:adenylate cyclase
LSNLLRKSLVAVGLGFGAALLALGLGRLAFVQTVELKSYDWRMRRTADPAQARRDIVIVNIDEASIRALAPFFGRWPWPRVVHAHALDFLTRAKPKVVVYDIFFGEPDRSSFKLGDDEWTGERSDAALAAAAGGLGSLIVPGDATEEAARGSSGMRAIPALPGPRLPLDRSIEVRPLFNPPMAPLLASARAIGQNLAVADADGVIRRYVPAVRVGTIMVPSLAVAGSIVALGLKDSDLHLDAAGLRLGDRTVPLVTSTIPTLDGTIRSARRLQIAYSGVWPDQRRTYATYSFAQLFQAEEQLLADEKPAVDPAEFRDKIVIVGATAAGLYDQKAVPFAQKMSGSEIHAQVIDSILSNRFLSPAAPSTGAAITIVAALVAALATVAIGPWVGVAVGLSLSGALIVGLTTLFARGMWAPLVEPLSAVAIATFAGVAYQYAVEGREKRRVKRIFSRYVSKDVYQQLLESPEEARLGGHRRFMTVLFCDIRGFTAVSERGQPEAIVAQLNPYVSTMVPVVFEQKGTVDKFVGDIIMALYGAPLDDPDHADHAVQTALSMTEALAKLNAEWAAAGRPTLDIGVGINTGDMVAGNLGSESIMSYTVIGDNVNLGSRLESLTRGFQTRVIISDATRDALKRPYDLRPLGEVTVKGKSVPVKVFELRLPSAVSEALNAYSPLAPAADKEKAASPPPVQKES